METIMTVSHDLCQELVRKIEYIFFSWQYGALKFPIFYYVDHKDYLVCRVYQSVYWNLFDDLFWAVIVQRWYHDTESGQSVV